MNGSTKPGWSKYWRTLSICQLAVEPGLGQRLREVLAVLPAAGVASCRRWWPSRAAAVAGVVASCSASRQVRIPVAVAPEHRQVDAAAGQLGLQRRLQRAVLRVDRADAAEGAVVVATSSSRSSGMPRPRVTLRRNGMTSSWPSGPAEAGEQDGVVGLRGIRPARCRSSARTAPAVRVLTAAPRRSRRC